jgi:hypothetical protein
MKAAILAILAVGLLVTHGVAATYKPSGELATLGSAQENFVLKAESIRVNDVQGVAVASGRAHIWCSDPAKKATLEADAAKIVVVRNPTQSPKAAKAAGGGLSAKLSIKSAVLTGPVRLVYSGPAKLIQSGPDAKLVHPGPDASGTMVKVTATADNADFDGIANVAHLVGNVKIISENPALDAAPTVMTGDRATVNLTRDLGPDDFRFSFEGSPAAITATPKPKEDK